MFNDWFHPTSLSMTWEEFRALPRHPAYRYEFKDSIARISGRPNYYHAKLNLERLKEPPADINVRSIPEADQQIVAELFSECFEQQVPFVHLPNTPRKSGVAAILESTWQGQDGPLVGPASFILESEIGPVGFVLVTLLPSGDLTHFQDEQWKRTPPAEPVQKQWGVPHLTWIGISPKHARQGLGQGLLQLSASALRRLGYSTLYSTFLNGNQPAMLWHWKMGFELLSHPSSSGG